jgi:hypothetical protein
MHAKLDETAPGTPDASRLTRDLVSLNASIVGLARQLRLAPQQIITPHSRGVLSQTTPRILDDPLIGTRVLRQ